MRSLILPLSIVMSLLSYGLVARWYVMPALAAMPIGMAFLIPGVTAEVLDPWFANPAAYGDLLAAWLALIAIMALRFEWAAAMPLVWIFNIEGSLDLLNALYRGFRYIPEGDLGATYFIPAVIVPALLVTHAMVFMLLWRPEATHR